MTSDIPGVYRQTTENNGMYSPFKKQLIRAHYIVPSKNCATQKIIPSHSPLKPFNFSRNSIPVETFKSSYSADTFRSSNSLPMIQNYVKPNTSVDHLYSNSEYQKFDYSDRPYTPPEKRYSSSFGTKALDKKTNGNKQRPRSTYIYENVHADEFCVANECNMNRVKSDRGLYPSANVKVINFPTPQFSRMYIQDNQD